MAERISQSRIEEAEKRLLDPTLSNEDRSMLENFLKISRVHNATIDTGLADFAERFADKPGGDA